jgi:hypothetical protein
VRAWLATDPDVASMQEVFKELSARAARSPEVAAENTPPVRASSGCAA